MIVNYLKKNTTARVPAIWKCLLKCLRGLEWQSLVHIHNENKVNDSHLRGKKYIGQESNCSILRHRILDKEGNDSTQEWLHQFLLHSSSINKINGIKSNKTPSLPRSPTFTRSTQHTNFSWHDRYLASDLLGSREQRSSRSCQNCFAAARKEARREELWGQ